MKIPKKAVTISLIIIATIFAVFFVRFFLGGPEDSWICVNGEWVQHGAPSMPMPDEPCTPVKNTATVTISDVTLYRGTWFDIEYPNGFTPSPTTPTEIREGATYVQTDEARFVSPDGTIEFFVFSPLWGGDPADYLTIGPAEELVDEETQESGAGVDSKITRWVTVRATDGSYYRSFVSIKSQVGTGSDLHHVFGIKYRDNETYELYRDAYVDFKNSLNQYSD
ncbi:MAG: hypothetical protein PHW53_03805 [Patescibacteria group bacterium]|nr:hypothetical protein [Patescibacteria group bacterium]